MGSQRHPSLFQSALQFCTWTYFLLCTQQCQQVHSHWSGVFNLKFDHTPKKKKIYLQDLENLGQQLPYLVQTSYATDSEAPLTQRFFCSRSADILSDSSILSHSTCGRAVSIVYTSNSSVPAAAVVSSATVFRA